MPTDWVPTNSTMTAHYIGLDENQVQAGLRRFSEQIRSDLAA